jgi:hypothetical protein
MASQQSHTGHRDARVEGEVVMKSSLIREAGMHAG